MGTINGTARGNHLNTRLSIKTASSRPLALFASENLHPYLRNALDAEILLDGRLVAAEHSGPVEGTTDRNTPEAMPHRGTRIHVEEFHPAGIRVLLPDARSSARPGQSVAQDEEQRAD